MSIPTMMMVAPAQSGSSTAARSGEQSSTTGAESTDFHSHIEREAAQAAQGNDNENQSSLHGEEQHAQDGAQTSSETESSAGPHDPSGHISDEASSDAAILAAQMFNLQLLSEPLAQTELSAQTAASGAQDTTTATAEEIDSQTTPSVAPDEPAVFETPATSNSEAQNAPATGSETHVSDSADDGAQLSLGAQRPTTDGGLEQTFDDQTGSKNNQNREQSTTPPTSVQESNSTTDETAGAPAHQVSDLAQSDAPETESNAHLQPVAHVAPASDNAMPVSRIALTPVTAAPATTPAGMLEQVRGPVGRLTQAGTGEHTFTVNVTPENLGPVTVKAHIGTEGIRVELIGATDAARDSLKAILNDLRRDLQSTGMTAHLGVSADTGERADSDASQTGLRSAPTRGAAGAAEPLEETSESPLMSQSDQPAGALSVDILA